MHTIFCRYDGVRVVRSLVFCAVFCRSLFVLLFCFFWPLCCLSIFDLQRILITTLVSSNSSYSIVYHHDMRKNKISSAVAFLMLLIFYISGMFTTVCYFYLFCLSLYFIELICVVVVCCIIDYCCHFLNVLF
jgi:hypothetical protein